MSAQAGPAPVYFPAVGPSPGKHLSDATLLLRIGTDTCHGADKWGTLGVNAGETVTGLTRELKINPQLFPFLFSVGASIDISHETVF